jgi:chloramphenicol-sensitive protein RarD
VSADVTPSSDGRGGEEESRQGVAYALAAFVAWGIMPMFFKLLSGITNYEVVAHRAMWAVVILAVPVTIAGRWGYVRVAFQSRQVMMVLIFTAALLSVNWMVFMWGVNVGRVLEISLGYYINPLISVVFGLLLLQEKLSRWQIVAVVLAAVGVLNQTLGYGQFPWVSMFLAISFAIYGYARKVVKVAALEGLMLETLLMAPFGLAFIVYLGESGSFGWGGWYTSFLLFCTGAATALPLLWFTAGARRLRLSTIGILQYLAPSMHFVLAVFVYREPFTTTHLITFGCIWLALIIYTTSSIRSSSR